MGGFGDIGDIFDTVFGGGRTSARSANGPKRGSDITASLEISLMESCKGVSTDIEINAAVTCETCGGNGAKPGTSVKSCPECNGQGVERRIQRTFLGSMESTQTCSRCNGKGKLIEVPCVSCNGAGRVQKKKRITVDIPAGINHGQTLAIRGHGNAGINGGANGDLNLRIIVKSDPIFKRDGFDILIDVPVTYAEAALGANIIVPTLDGEATLVIPDGTQPNTILRMKGKGVQFLQKSGRGDQYCNIVVEVPKKLTKHQKDLLNQLQESFNVG